MSITDEELREWAEKRADDAGRLARELVPLLAELSEAYGYATRFLQAFCENNGLRQVKPLPTLCGVLTQIDNATTALRARVAELEARLADTCRVRDEWCDAYTKLRDEARPLGDS